MEFIKYTKEGHFLADTEQIGVIAINRPPVNAFSPELVNELSEILDQIEKDNDIRVVIIRSAVERAFSVGLDVGAAAQLAQDLEKGKQFLAAGQELFRRIESFSKPVIAELNGWVLGGGLELAMSCDIRIAAKDARLGNPEVRLGLFPAWGGTQRLPKLVGLGRAKEFILTGKRDLPAEDALAMGLVNKVVETDELHEQGLFLAQEIANKAPIAVSLAKELMNKSLDLSIEEGNKAEMEACIKCFQTEDLTIGFTAFLQKSEPKFKGK